MEFMQNLHVIVDGYGFKKGFKNKKEPTNIVSSTYTY